MRERLRAIELGALLVVAASVLAGCSLQKITVRQTADVLWSGQQALEGEPDPAFAREALPGSLKTIETFLETDPENRKMLRMLAKGHFSYTFAFVEGDLERAQAEHASEERIEGLKRSAILGYLKCRDYGLRLLAPGFGRAARGLDVNAVQAYLADMDEDDVPGLFWAAYGWGSAANLGQNNPDMVAALPIVEAMMNRVIELDESFFFSGPHMFFGVYYASRPPMFGGKPDRAREHFEAAMEAHGDRNLMIPFLYARFYATQVQDHELFDQLLNQLREADVEGYRRVRLNNAVARDRADFWEGRKGDLFFDWEPEGEDAASGMSGAGGFGGGGFADEPGEPEVEQEQGEDEPDDLADPPVSADEPAEPGA